MRDEVGKRRGSAEQQINSDEEEERTAEQENVMPLE